LIWQLKEIGDRGLKLESGTKKLVKRPKDL